MKTLQVLEPEKLTPEEVKALRNIGFSVDLPLVTLHPGDQFVFEIGTGKLTIQPAEHHDA